MSIITPSGLPTELTEITNGETLIEVYNPDTGQNEKVRADTLATYSILNAVSEAELVTYSVTNNDIAVVNEEIPVLDGTTGKIIKSSGTTLTSLQSDISAKLTGVTDQLCKAWVNFNGTGVVAIRDSFNVSSITDNGTGDYTINFSNPMNDTNYSVCLGLSFNVGAANTVVLAVNSLTAPNINAIRIGSVESVTGAAYDPVYVNAQILGS